jgi:hypothetical protein
VKEHPLKFASAAFALGMNFVEEPAETRHSPPAPSSAYLKAKLTVVDDPHDFRLPQSLFQFPGREEGREIQQRPRNRGAGNSAKFGPIRRREAPVSVGNDSGGTASPAVGGNHVDRGIVRLPKSPESRCRTMRQYGTRPAHEYSREKCCFRRRADVPDRVDASMDSMEAAGPLASGNGPSIDPHAFELFEADQAVLPVRDPGNLEVPSSRSKPTGRFVEFQLTMGRFVKPRWTDRPVGGCRGGGICHASEAYG